MTCTSLANLLVCNPVHNNGSVIMKLVVINKCDCEKMQAMTGEHSWWCNQSPTFRFSSECWEAGHIFDSNSSPQIYEANFAPGMGVHGLKWYIVFENKQKTLA